MVYSRYALLLVWRAVWCLLTDVCYRQAPNKTSLVVKHDVLPVPTHGTRRTLSDTGPACNISVLLYVRAAAFVEFEDEAGVANALAPDMQMFGVVLKVRE